LTLEDKAFGDDTPGRLAWLFQEPVLFKTPIPARGRLILWAFNEGLIIDDIN
jgi:hypothetical protein